MEVTSKLPSNWNLAVYPLTRDVCLRTRKVAGPNVVSVLGAVVQSDYIAYVMNHMKQDLQQYLLSKTGPVSSKVS